MGTVAQITGHASYHTSTAPPNARTDSQSSVRTLPSALPRSAPRHFPCTRVTEPRTAVPLPLPTRRHSPTPRHPPLRTAATQHGTPAPRRPLRSKEPISARGAELHLAPRHRQPRPAGEPPAHSPFCESALRGARVSGCGRRPAVGSWTLPLKSKITWFLLWNSKNAD